jgi:hypothetical protein
VKIGDLLNFKKGEIITHGLVNVKGGVFRNLREGRIDIQEKIRNFKILIKSQESGGPTLD